jgi:hypothetical protein
VASLCPFRQRLPLSGIFFLPDLIDHCVCFFLVIKRIANLSCVHSFKWYSLFFKRFSFAERLVKQANPFPTTNI